MSSNLNKLYVDGFLTQWALHIVKEHSNRSSDVGVRTFRSWRHTQSNPELTSRPELEELFYHLGRTSSILLRNFNVLLTQWDFHRVQEHSNRSSNEGDMTFRSWRSCAVSLDELT